MIVVSHLTKKYGSLTAVDDVSFTAREGEILGFLGPNGAGKTTTMNMITGYISITGGSASIAGYDIYEQPMEAKKRIGYLPEQPPLYPDMTVDEYLGFISRLKKSMLGQKHLDEICELVRLTDVRGRLIKNLSKGYRQRVGLAQALCGDPEVLILDEPTVGLDPRQTAEFRETLRQIARDRTVIFSSHILSEVQSLCDRVLILHHGKLVYDHDAHKLSAATKMHARILKDEKTLLPALRSLEHITRVVKMPAQEAGAIDVMLECSALLPAQKELHTLLCALNAPLLRLTPVDETLEDVFLRCTQGG